MSSAEVFIQTFWMKWFQHPTPKRSLVISNSPLIRVLDKGSMTRAELESSVVTTDRYLNKKGERRFKGNANLKSTQCLGVQGDQWPRAVETRLYTWKYAFEIAKLGMEARQAAKDCIPNVPGTKHEGKRATEVDMATPLIDMYRAYEWGDLWNEADLLAVVRYLRGSKKLTLPPEWRGVLPRHVVDTPDESM